MDVKSYTVTRHNDRYYVHPVFAPVKLIGNAVAGPFDIIGEADQAVDRFAEIDRKNSL